MTVREPVYTLRQNGGPEVKLADLALAFTGLRLVNMQADEVSLRWTRRTGGQACPLAYNDVVEIYRDGHRIFTGRASKSGVSWDGCSVRLRGPWSHFEEFTAHLTIGGSVLVPKVGDTFIQYVGDGVEIWNGYAWQVLTEDITWTVGYDTVFDPEAPNVGTLDVNRAITSRFWLYSAEGLLVTLVTQMTGLLTYAAHVAEVAYFQEGTLEYGDPLAAKQRTVQDVSVGEALRQTLTPKPDMALWWDYSGGPDAVPVLNGRVATLETVQELMVGQADGQVLPGYDLTPLNDMVVSGLVVREEWAASEATGRGLPQQVATAPMETAGYQRKALVQTVTEVSGLWELVVPEVMAALSRPRAQGTLQVLDTHLTMGLRPGRVLRLLGDPEVEGVDLWVQQVDWQPQTGVATLQVGYPEHLEISDFKDLRRFFYRCFYPGGTPPRQIGQIIGS